MAEETSADIAYAHAKENLSSQRAALDNLRTRSAAVITAAAVIASFLGGQALADTKVVPSVSSPVADRSLQFWESFGFAGFVAVLAISVWIIKPKSEAWTFRLDAKWILRDADEKSRESRSDVAQLQKRDLAEYMEVYYEENQTRIDKLVMLLQVSVILLVLEAAGFMFDLTGFYDFTI